MSPLPSSSYLSQIECLKAETRRFDMRAHFLAWAILAGCMSTLGYLAIERCIDVEIAQELDRQENFSAYRTAASYAGETVR